MNTNDDSGFGVGQESVNLTGSEGQIKVIPVVEEFLKIGKKVEETGQTKITKFVREEEVKVDVSDFRDDVEIERIAVNKTIDEIPSIRQEGDITIIPIIKEVVVVEKRLMLVEELRITKKKVENKNHQTVLLRKEEVVIEQIVNGVKNANSVNE